MAKPLPITIKESLPELRSLQRKHPPMIAKRIELLIAIKQHEDIGILSKYALSEKTGLNHNSIVKWRKMYLASGIESLLTHGRVGFKPNSLTPSEHELLEAKLQEHQNGIQGYKELFHWLNKELNKNMKYSTLYKYCRKQFGSKIKVARKSHLNKDNQAVEAFKKTLQTSSLK